ncbi:hypothetical protein C7212DRAFT_219539, partial [Tuber magnatum]
GLDVEFSIVLNSTFLSWILLPILAEKVGNRHMIGNLLFWPGTCKILTTGQIGKMLNIVEPQAVNGSEILNNYIAQLEEEVRVLFTEVEKGYKEKKVDSGIYLMTFDRLDDVCKQREIKNQEARLAILLRISFSGRYTIYYIYQSYLPRRFYDLYQLGDILIISMTSHVGMIDEAVQDPGYPQVLVESALPNEFDPHQILQIRTNKLSRNKVIDSDVDIQEIASNVRKLARAIISRLGRDRIRLALNHRVGRYKLCQCLNFLVGS